jgi:hypothetical protein
MKLKKALEIVNYYAYLILRGDDLQIEKLDISEVDELDQARDMIKEFLEQFK